MRFLVLGSGMMGSALAYDLAHSRGVEEILITDIDEQRARLVAESLGERVHSARLNINYYDDVVAAMSGIDVAIGAVSYTYNYMLTKAAIESGTHFLDLGGNNDVVERQLTLHEKAQAAGVCIIPNCGLAPGLANVLAASGAKRFETLKRLHIRVGGLPQQPVPPLNYQLVFSPDGLINEYIEPAEIIRNGHIEQVESMTDIEEIVFPEPFGALEAFNTSGGLSTLARMFEGKVNEMDYKTIRYKGHCEKFKVLLDVGFASSEPIMAGDTVRTAREIFADLLRKKLPANGPDVVLLRVTIDGTIDGQQKTLAYEMIDYYDESNKITAMMRTTAYPTSVISQMVGQGEITSRGVLPPEQCVPAGPMIEELKKRNIVIKVTEQ
jgi:lysine 6-dehydrogenase